jgi:hypothetical protein
MTAAGRSAGYPRLVSPSSGIDLVAGGCSMPTSHLGKAWVAMIRPLLLVPLPRRTGCQQPRDAAPADPAATHAVSVHVVDQASSFDGAIRVRSSASLVSADGSGVAGGHLGRRQTRRSPPAITPSSISTTATSQRLPRCAPARPRVTSAIPSRPLHMSRSRPGAPEQATAGAWNSGAGLPNWRTNAGKRCFSTAHRAVWHGWKGRRHGWPRLHEVAS